MEISSDRAICHKCGTAFSRYKGYFPVSYAVQHKGLGYIPVCKTCIDNMYNTYLSQCNDAKAAVRQMCRKLDLFYSDNAYELVCKKSTPRTMMTQYIAKINSLSYAGKSYDDTLSDEGTLWDFMHREKDTTNTTNNTQENNAISNKEAIENDKKEEEKNIDIDIPEEVRNFWGSGYSPEMYAELEQRKELDAATVSLLADNNVACK